MVVDAVRNLLQMSTSSVPPPAASPSKPWTPPTRVEHGCQRNSFLTMQDKIFERGMKLMVIESYFERYLSMVFLTTPL
ncbi:hypothetical protein PHAVU_L010643 [Phaseolus vulgaris]|uniref:Uncharacterized protein n=2 Tax=Phaseolus vulgaris TaxID=3885 RepID=A0ACC3P207_PHAVU|nr:hypothetical protein PHAVU_005G149000g [Phaseolus vulgaris]ESW22381.1 hypothetical protein PHAVU_005G149000g [Phaseolus vulgaris]